MMIFRFPTPVFNAEGTGGGGAAPPPNGGTQTPPPGNPPPADQPTPGNPPAWFAGLEGETLGWVQNRGYDKLEGPAAIAEVIKGHRNLEAHMGVPPERLLKLPEKLEGDALMPIFDKLGRPAKPEDYGIKLADETAIPWVSKMFHEAGVTKSQADKLAATWAAQAEAHEAAETQKQQATAVQEKAALEAEWANATAHKTHVASQAAAAFGVDKATMDKLESVLGYGATMRFFNAIGEKLGEDNFIGGKVENLGATLSPAQAAAKLNDLKNDAEWRKNYLAGGVAETATFKALTAIIAPGVPG